MRVVGGNLVAGTRNIRVFMNFRGVSFKAVGTQIEDVRKDFIVLMESENIAFSGSLAAVELSVSIASCCSREEVECEIV